MDRNLKDRATVFPGATMNDKKSIWDYEEIIGRCPLEYLELLAENVTGKVQHINATYSGGGVAEILTSLIPLFNGLGIETEWNVLRGDDKFFSVTKNFHNALHGSVNSVNSAIDVHTYEQSDSLDNLESQIAELAMRKDMFATYLHWNSVNSEELDVDGDFVFMHDPQPAAMIHRCIQSGSLCLGLSEGIHLRVRRISLLCAALCETGYQEQAVSCAAVDRSLERQEHRAFGERDRHRAR